jgi:hypothetical protein
MPGFDPNYFVEREWLERVRNKPFMYCAAGDDHAAPLNAFIDFISDFTFVDLRYQFNRLKPALARHPEFERIRRRKVVVPDTIETHPGNECGPSAVQPEVYVEEYADFTKGRAVRVTRRLGFGQYAVEALPPTTLGVFMHRGDSGGEGGSGIQFLTNVKNAHAPSNQMMHKLYGKLADHSLVIADSSTLGHELWHEAYGSAGQEAGADAYERLKGKRFNVDHCVWSCVGFLGQHRGATLVWGVSQDPDSRRFVARNKAEMQAAVVWG